MTGRRHPSRGYNRPRMMLRSLARIAPAAMLLVLSLSAGAQGFSSVSSKKPDAAPLAPPVAPSQSPAPVAPSSSGSVVPAAPPAFSSTAAPAAASPSAPLPQAAEPLPSSSPPPSPSPPAAAARVTVPFGSGSSSTAVAPKTSFEPADRVLVKKSERRLYLMHANRIIADYPIRLGLNPNGHKEREGDFRTPEGSYQLVRRNPRSDFFLSLEVSYPNDADRARAKKMGVRPGGLIMIHGQPNVPRKSPDYYVNFDWTDGCIAVSNSDMVDIWLRTGPGTPIEIRP